MIELAYVAFDFYAILAFLMTGVLSVSTAIILIIISFKVKELIIDQIKKL